MVDLILQGSVVAVDVGEGFIRGDDHLRDPLLPEEAEALSNRSSDDTGARDEAGACAKIFVDGGENCAGPEPLPIAVVDGLEERLKSRFGWGLTVAVEPPELETRVAILMKKAEQANIDLPREAAFFVAQRIKSNVRELEGALKRVIASSQFTHRRIDIELVKESLKDLLALQDKLVSLDNIQRTVAEYYKIKLSDLLSKRRSRSVARPRQLAMALAKELTNHSLPEIGEAFGGRDHTTVLHACRKIRELQHRDPEIRDDYTNLLGTLTN